MEAGRCTHAVLAAPTGAPHPALGLERHLLSTGLLVLGLFPHPQQSWKPVQGTAAPQQVDEQAWLGPSGTSCSERTNLACKPWWAGPAQGFCSLPATYLPRNLVPISHLAAIS